MISLTYSLAVIPPIVLHSSSGRVAQSKLQEGKNGGVVLECSKSEVRTSLRNSRTCNLSLLMLVKGFEEKGCAVISAMCRLSDLVSSKLKLITSVRILS